MTHDLDFSHPRIHDYGILSLSISLSVIVLINLLILTNIANSSEQILIDPNSSEQILIRPNK